jgi:Cu-Zn family superoxide dismutase
MRVPTIVSPGRLKRPLAARAPLRSLRAGAPALALVLLATACGGQSPAASPEGEVADHSPGAGSGRTTLSGGGEFAPRTTAAIVYDRKLVPRGAQASVTAESAGGKTLTSLVVEGLLPDHRYGAHLHTAPCGAHPRDAGGHFQHVPDRADAMSEVWLNLRTDDSGAGRATARHDWSMTGVMPRSLVLHAAPASPSRVACVTLY